MTDVRDDTAIASARAWVLIIAPLLTAFSVGCGAFESPDPGLLNLSDCADASDWWECARVQEVSLLARTRDVVRLGDTLVFNVPDQEPLRLVDEVDDWGVGHQYLYNGFSAGLRAHLVDLRLYEGGNILVVWPRSGRMQVLDAMPHVSPNGARVVTASWDTEAGYIPNRVQILRKQSDSLALEWELEPQLWGPDDPWWLNDSTIVIVRRPALGHPDSAALRAPLTLRLSRDGWTADSTAP